MGWPRRRRQQQQQLRRRASKECSDFPAAKPASAYDGYHQARQNAKKTPVWLASSSDNDNDPALEDEASSSSSRPAKTLDSSTSKWHYAPSPRKTQSHQSGKRGGLREKLYSVDSLAETDDEDDDDGETESEEGSEHGDLYSLQLCHQAVASVLPAAPLKVVHAVQEEEEEEEEEEEKEMKPESTEIPPVSTLSKTLDDQDEDDTDVDDEEEEGYASDQQPTFESVVTAEEYSDVQEPLSVADQAKCVASFASSSNNCGKSVDGEDTESEDGDDAEPFLVAALVSPADLQEAVVKVDLFGQSLSDSKTKVEPEHAPFLFPPPYFPGDLDEYESDIYETLLRREKIHHVVTDYFSFQPHVTSVMRAMLVDWLVEVHNHFNLQPETLYLTVNYIDRFLSKVSVKRENFQLVALTALLIASKFEEVHPVDIEDLVYICERSYTAQQIVQFEKQMLHAFRFNLVVPTCGGFLEYYVEKLSPALQVAQLANFFCEQTLLDFHLNAKYVPSVIASSALLLAQCYVEKAKPELAWVLEFEEVTGYYAKDIWCCVRDVSDMLASLSFDLVAVRTKFRSGRFGRVADLPHVNVSGIRLE